MGKTIILSVIDRFSKAAHFIALQKIPTASETAKLLVEHVFRLHGIPAEIVSDRGPQFSSQVWRAFCTALGAKACLSSGYHPQTNGQTEYLNQELETTLRCVTSNNPASWSSYLPWIEYAHNSLVSSATGVSPFEASIRYQPPLFPEQDAELAMPSVLQHCRRAWTRTRDALLRTVSRQRHYANQRRTSTPVYAAGQQVWLAAKDIPLLATTAKLAPRFIGPFRVERVLSLTALRLSLSPTLRIHPVFHVSQVKPVSSSPLFCCRWFKYTTTACWNNSWQWQQDKSMSNTTGQWSEKTSHIFPCLRLVDLETAQDPASGPVYVLVPTQTG